MTNNQEEEIKGTFRIKVNASEWQNVVGSTNDEKQIGRHCVLKCLGLVKSDIVGGLVFLIVGMRGKKYEIYLDGNHYEVEKDLVKII